MSSDLSVAIRVSAIDQASAVLRGIGGNVSDAFSKLPAPIKAVGGILAGVGLAAVAVGVKSTQMAAEYQQSMLKVQSLAGYTKQQMDQASQAILAMAGQVGKSPKELADALFYVASAGFKGSQALNILKLSAQAAATGGTDVKTVADGLTSALNAFGISGDHAGMVMDQITKTVASGKMQMGDYVSVIGKLSTVSKASGVSFIEANAALATMTNSGYSAQYGSTLLSNLFTSLDLKTDALAKHAKSLGVSFDEQKFKSMGLGEQIKYLNTLTDGNSSSMLKLLGNNATALKTFEALKNNLSSYNSTLNTVKNSQGAAAQAFAVAQQGFNQQMAQAKASVDALMIRIGTALLPVLSKLMGQIAPLIAQLTQWILTHHVLENTATVLQSVLSGLVTGISTLAQWISQIVGFFQHNSVAADALKAALAGLAVGVGVWIATLIPGLVMSFIAWAAAAGAAALATLAAAAPFILIGVIVAAVVFGIIMAVKHWGQITDWLKGVWSAFSSWWSSALHAIGDFFKHIWDSIVSGLRAAWNFIVTVVKVGVTAILLIIFGPILAIGALFVWLYNHNTYFKMLCDAIVNFFKAAIAWLQSAWETVTGWLSAKWQWLTGVAAGAWRAISAAIQAAVQAAWAWLVSIWTTATSWLSAKWNSFAGLARSAWAAVSSVFASIWGTYIAGPLSSLWSSFSGWFGNLASQALQWGVNLIQGFINGILSMAGGVGNAVSSIAGKVASFLGFHSPAKEGPGSTAHLWGPNLVNMFSNDISSHSPKARAAAEHMMAQVARAMKSYPDQIAMAHLEGNKVQEKALRAQFTNIQDQFKLYKDLLTEHGFKFDNKDLGNPIDFAPITKHAHHAAKKAVQRQGSGLYLGGSGSTTSSSLSTAGGSSSSSGGGLSITNNITINANAANAKELYKMLVDMLNRDMRRSGNFNTWTSGGKI